jgi:hypothetical protein
MVAATEALSAGPEAIRSSMIRRGATLARGDSRILVEGDGAVRILQSLSERRAIFGRCQVQFSKLQAGILVGAPKLDWSVRLTPTFAHFSGRVFDLEAAQVLEFSPFSNSGYLRRVRVRNAGSSSARLRLACLSDPTAAHFRDSANSWGSLGVNAFNRESHIVLDEISNPRPARVIGCSPSPSTFFMTTDRAKAAEALRADDLPEPTAGMSGQVIVLSFHEMVLAPSESRDIVFYSLYSPTKLEEVLSAFGRVQGEINPPPKTAMRFACSSSRITEVFDWACSAMEGSSYEPDLLDRLEVLRGLEYVDPASAEATMLESKGASLKSGLLWHSADRAKPGSLESSILLASFSRHLDVFGDKRRARQVYPFLRRMANALASLQKEGRVELDEALPQGWRRRVGTGYPSGVVPEVSLAVAASLSSFSRVSHLLGRGEDAARFREKSELIAESVAKTLVDDRGVLALCMSGDRLRTEPTIDIAVACYRNPALSKIASSGIPMLLEKDFGTDYGPRTVPTSNRMYFHGSYGQGQLGGYWTRAALAFACLIYAVGLSGMGSLIVEKVANLVTKDAPNLGGVPGEFPYWVDVDGKETHGEKSDPVAAARFVQALVEGELGLDASAVPSFSPPALSAIKWLLARDIWVGERVTLFVGRKGEKVYSFGTCQRTGLDGGHRFARSEQVEVVPRGAHSVSFFGPGQVVCVGNSSNTAVAARVTLAPKSPGLSKRLMTPLEEFDSSNRSWNKIGSLRVSPSITFDAPLGPGDWKAYRVSND